MSFNDNSITPGPDRLPPHSIDAEYGFLGAILLGGKETFEQHPINPTVFYDLRNREIYMAMLKLFNSNIQIDMITVIDCLRNADKLETVGGVAHLMELPDKTASPGMAGDYVEVMRDCSIRRDIIRICSDAIDKSYHENVLSKLESQLLHVHQDIRRSRHIRLVYHDAMKLIQDAHEDPSNVATPTGFGDLDGIIGGVVPGEMYILAGRPSTGKTSLATNLIWNIASRGTPTAFFSLEMSDVSTVIRMISSMSGVPASLLLHGRASQSEIPKVVNTSKLATTNIHIDDRPGISLADLRAEAMRLITQFGVRFVVIDYLQLMSNETKHGQYRQFEIAQISSGLKNLAKETGVPFLVLSQLNRQSGDSERPRMQDLRESGQIEQDADVVMLLWRPDPTRRDRVELIVAKQRNGKVGSINLSYNQETMTFGNASKFDSEDLPAWCPSVT